MGPDYNHHPTGGAFITFVHYGMDLAMDYGFIPRCHGWDIPCCNLYTDNAIPKAHLTTSALRIKEAKKLGFKKCILSKSNQQACRALKGIDLVGIDSVNGLMEMLL